MFRFWTRKKVKDLAYSVDEKSLSVLRDALRSNLNHDPDIMLNQKKHLFEPYFDTLRNKFFESSYVS